VSNHSSNVPFPPAKWPFFYGWMILVVGTLGMIMSAPGQTMGVSVFTDHLIEALKITRFQLSLAYMFGTIASSLLLIKGGALYDRYGARTCCVAVAILLGLTLLALSRVDIITEWLVKTASLGEYRIQTAFVTVLLAFFFLRFFGQGMLSMVSRNMIVKWFDRRRGLAIGISGVFVGFGFSCAPRFLEYLVQSFTWRGAWVLCASVIGLGFAIVALLFYRDNPEDCGLRPDGLPPDPSYSSAEEAKSAYTLREAIRTYPFWILNLGLGMLALYSTAVTFHIVSIFSTAGMDRVQAVSIFIPSSIIAVFVNLIAGRLSDFMRLKYLLILLLAGLSVQSIAVALLRPGFWVWVLIVTKGISEGLFGVLMAVSWPRFYGRIHLGAIAGFNMSCTVFFSAIGPSLFAFSLATTDSYRISSLLCGAVSAVLAFLALKADPPHAKNLS